MNRILQLSEEYRKLLDYRNYVKEEQFYRKDIDITKEETANSMKKLELSLLDDKINAMQETIAEYIIGLLPEGKEKNSLFHALKESNNNEVVRTATIKIFEELTYALKHIEIKYDDCGPNIVNIENWSLIREGTIWKVRRPDGWEYDKTWKNQETAKEFALKKKREMEAKGYVVVKEKTEAALSMKEKRLALGLSQSALAERSGLPVQRIQRIEQGVTNINTIDIAAAYCLAKALKCNIEDIMISEEQVRYVMKKEKRSTKKRHNNL